MIRLTLFYARCSKRKFLKSYYLVLAVTLGVSCANDLAA
ncbi:MAG: hypothetical protein ACI9ST_000260 [Psychrobacter glaciei]|jgi:hypothetical protein